MNRKIGVLGGIGPEATAEFYGKLIKRLQQRGLIRKNEDFPQIIINSIPAPELIKDSISEKDLLPYRAGLRELERFKVDFIVMVCNTIHLYHKSLQNEISTPIVDLREEVRAVLKKKMKSTLIIGTPTTIKRGLYSFNEAESFEPNEAEMKQLSKSIFDFNKGFEKQAQKAKVRKICRKYLKMGAECVVLGCTEFAVMLEKEKFPKISTIDVLVEAAIDKTFS